MTHARLETNKKAREYQPHGWFVCFAPADNPKVAMVVMVEHGTAGGTSAAPVAGQNLSRYFGVRAIGPGMTPPPVSLTTPEIDALDWAKTPAGANAMSRAASHGLAHRLARNIFTPLSKPAAQAWVLQVTDLLPLAGC